MASKEFSSGGVIIKEEKGLLSVLLIKDRFGRWTWPKGNIEAGETPEQAAVREIGEEVGLEDIRLLDKIDDIKYTYRRGKEEIFKTVAIYLFEAAGNDKIEPQLSEIAEAAWMARDKALDAIEYNGAAAVLKKAIDRFIELKKH